MTKRGYNRVTDRAQSWRRHIERRRLERVIGLKISRLYHTSHDVIIIDSLTELTEYYLEELMRGVR